MSPSWYLHLQRFPNWKSSLPESRVLLAPRQAHSQGSLMTSGTWAAASKSQTSAPAKPKPTPIKVLILCRGSHLIRLSHPFLPSLPPSAFISSFFFLRAYPLRKRLQTLRGKVCFCARYFPWKLRMLLVPGSPFFQHFGVLLGDDAHFCSPSPLPSKEFWWSSVEYVCAREHEYDVLLGTEKQEERNRWAP